MQNQPAHFNPDMLAKLSMALASRPNVFVKSLCALIEDAEPKSLSELGLSPNSLAELASSAYAMEQFDPDSLRNLAQVLACSPLPISDLKPFEAALRAIQEDDPELHPLLNLSENDWHTDWAMDAPSLALWLDSPVSNFDAEKVWISMNSSNSKKVDWTSGAQGFLTQCAADGTLPDHNWIERVPPAFAERLLIACSEQHGPLAVLEAAESWRLDQPEQADLRKAIYPVLIEFLCQEPDLKGEHITNLLINSVDAGDDHCLSLLAGRAGEMRIKTRDDSKSNHFIYHGNGHGGVFLTDFDCVDAFDIRLSHFAFALDGEPRQNLENDPYFSKLARSIESLGIDDPQCIPKSQAIREIAMIHYGMKCEHMDPDYAKTRCESVVLRADLPAATSHPKPALRV